MYVVAAVSIVALIVLLAQYVWSSVQIRRLLAESSVATHEAILLADRTQLRQQVILADVMDRIMAMDFTTYKELKDVDISEGGFEGPETEEEGGVETSGPWSKTESPDERAARVAAEEESVLAEDFDETGEPRRGEVFS